MKVSFQNTTQFKKMLLLLCLLLVYPATGYSLDNERWSSGLNFSFYPPGARALAMGGAFVGLADDATAAASNPAGLSQLSAMQIAIEGRYISQDKERKSFPWQNDAGHGKFVTESEVDDMLNVSFAAFTTPLLNNLFTLSFFYDKPMSFSSTKSTKRTWEGLQTSQFSSTMDISLDEVGLSLARSFYDGRLMFGFGIGVQFFGMDGELNRSIISPPFTFRSFKVDENNLDLSFRLGVLGRPIDNLRLGANLTVMPRFDYSIKDVDLIKKTSSTKSSSFDVPDNFSFGAAYNIFPNWVLILEGKYLMYSQLTDSFRILYPYLPENPRASQYSMDDIIEPHFGTEYVLNVVPNVPIALRAGTFFEPAHDLKYKGPGNMQSNLFDGGKDLMHYTFGTGAVFLNHYQVDIGADITEQSNNVTLSMVYQF